MEETNQSLRYLFADRQDVTSSTRSNRQEQISGFRFYRLFRQIFSLLLTSHVIGSHFSLLKQNTQLLQHYLFIYDLKIKVL
jgi:hypothetical protein